MLLAGCVSPAVNSDGYRGKVHQSAKKTAGIVAVARLAGQLDLGGKMLHNLTDNTVTDAENDADSVLASLDSVQPPDAASVDLRDRADSTLQTASGQLSDLRIAVRRGDRAAMRSALDDLGRTLADLQRLQSAAS